MNEEQARQETLVGRRPYEEEILAEQVKQLYTLAPVGMAATLINATLTYFVLLQGGLSERMLIRWLAVMFAVTLLKIGLQLWYRSNFRPSEAAIWGRRFIAGLVLIGIAWGSLGLLPFDGISPAHRVFITFILGGMAAGAAATFSTVRWGYPAFSIPAALPLGIHFFLLNEIMYYAMGGMLFLYVGLLWRLAEHNYQLSCTSLLLRFQNREMIESLRQAKESAEDLSRTLLSEIDAKLQAEAKLKAHQDHLEGIVADRTTDLLLANEQLTAAKDAAEAANQAKSEFLANMSHEIRTPLAGALGMINLVLEMKIGDEEKQFLEMAKRSADSLLHLISDLLDFARVEAGTMKFEKRSFPVSRAIRTAMEAVTITAREKGLHLSWCLKDGVPEILEGDEGRLRQVLVNLLGNAVKFTKNGEVEVAVRPFCDPDAPGRGFLVFSIRDTGIGIPPDQMEKIFGKFIQVDPSTTRRYGGTGLGLALSRQIVENMGGKIWAESRQGAGSTFSFTLPLDE
jgi:signal transduction histidine kinase